MLTTLYDVTFNQMLHYVILSNYPLDTAHNTRYPEWYVVVWFASISLFKQWQDECTSPFIWYFSNLH